MENFKILTSVEQRSRIEKIITDCEKLARLYVSTWKPINEEWQTVSGCAYLRLSDPNQIKEKGSLEQQINIAVAEAVSRSNIDRVNYRITKFFIEPGITGTHDRRPQFLQMKAEIKSGNYRFVIIKEIARLARETDLWKSFFKLCNTSDCEIIIRGFPFNPNDPAQIMQLDILAAFAEFESNQISRRVRENGFSAMLTSGKFFSTPKILGFDQLVVDGRPQAGFYAPNKKELESVEWIMRTFLRYRSYQKTIEVSNEMGVLNKNGRAFKKHSLTILLSNKRYIGEWELNKPNKEKSQDKLMPYDRFAVVKLPHGCVIDKSLWDEVQREVKSLMGNKGKNTRLKRIYPLSGVLRLKDSTPFHGRSAIGRGGNRSTYYFNTENNLRLGTELLEEEAKKIVGEIISQSPRLRLAIKRRACEAETAKQILKDQVRRSRDQLVLLESEKGALNRRLDFLLSGATESELETFKKEYAAELARINQETTKLNEQLILCDSRRQEIERAGVDWEKLGQKARAIQDLMQTHDPVALKGAYAKLFESIVIGDLDANGVRPLHFVLRDGGGVAAGQDFNLAANGSVVGNMAPGEGLEPPTGWLTATCSTS